MNWFWDNLLLKKEDRFGMLAFLSILIVLLLGKWYLVVFYKPDITAFEYAFDDVAYASIYEESPKEIPKDASSYKTKRKTPSSIPKQVPVSKRPIEKKYTLFDFDPNVLSLDSLQLLGISGYASNNIVKYRSKGGRFKDSEDLRKIYGMDETVFEKLEGHIHIKKEDFLLKAEIQEKQKWKKPKPKLALKSIDINRADTTMFKSLRGIGSVYANRIVKFRNSLGGYFSLDQINDVWGISDSLYLTIKPYLTIDSSLVKKKNINALTKDVLVKHPYIDWKKAKTITKYRKMHGDFTSMDDFKKLHGLEVEFVDTLKQYFVIQ